VIDLFISPLAHRVALVYYSLIGLNYLLAVLMVEIVDDPNKTSKPVLTPIMLIATKHTAPQINIITFGIS